MPMTREELIEKLKIKLVDGNWSELIDVAGLCLDHLQSSHEETEALKKELSAVRSLALKNDARASDADQYEQWLLEIGKQIGCQHLDEQLSNCVIQALQGDAESSHEAELMAIVEQAASETSMATNSFTCRKAGGNCSHQRARELLNKIKGE